MLVYAAVAAVAVLAVAYYLFGSGGSGPAASDGQKVSAEMISRLYAIANNQTLAGEIGIGSAASNFPAAVNGATPLVGDKPAIVYIGTDYCPYCAITRWSVMLALMRFGNFTLLHYTTSSASDIYPNSATFSFYNSSYSSALLSFVAAETQTRDGKPLQTLNALENATFDTYDLHNSALPTQLRGGIPFIDFANKSVQVGSAVSPQIISGKNWTQIVDALRNVNSSVAQGIIGNANVFTAYICASDASLKGAAACSHDYITRIRMIS